MSHSDALASPMGMNHIIIVGAGYVGLLAANRLAGNRQQPVRVTLVNERPDFVERVRLHELLAGSRDSVSTPLAQMLNPAVELVVDRVVGLAAHEVVLTTGERLAADHIVLAFGSGAAGGPTSLEGAWTLREDLTALAAGSVVQVLGAGLTGIEVASEIAEQRPDLRVNLVDPAGLAPGMTAPHRDRLARSLRRLGVEVSHRDAHVRVATLIGTAATALRPDFTVDCTGFRVPSLARDCGLPVDDDGRVLVDQTLAVPGHPGIWATGDCAQVQGISHLKMGCRAAEPLGVTWPTRSRRRSGEERPLLSTWGTPRSVSAWAATMG